MPSPNIRNAQRHYGKRIPSCTLKESQYCYSYYDCSAYYDFDYDLDVVCEASCMDASNTGFATVVTEATPEEISYELRWA